MLISKEYRKEQERLHENPSYGMASVGFAPIVSNLINQLGITEILDYGAGKQRLAQHITPEHKVTYRGYDPAIPELSEAPDSAQMVCCIDVLEHIEPALIDNVLDDLQRVVELVGFFTIHTGPAQKTLSDGRNAHLIQESYTWWVPKLWDRFDVYSFQQVPNGFFVVVRRGAQ